MKYLSSLFTLMVVTTLTITSAFAQSPNSFSYQAIVRDSNNVLVSSQNVGVEISILQGSATGTAVFVEEHVVATNINGLFSIQIGNGNVTLGDIATIDWANGPYFIKTFVDPAGGPNYSILGVSELLSVPYALHAKTADNQFSGDYNDLTNTPTLVSVFTNDAGYIIQELDGDSTNELQTLSAIGDTIFLSDGGFVTIPPSLDNDSTNELQMLSINGDTIFLTDGGFVTVPTSLDNDSTNEIQSISINGDTIFLTDGGFVTVPVNLDNDSTNELQMLSINGDTIFLTDGGFVTVPTSLDNDSTNEIQSISINGDTIFLTDGGFVTVPTSLDNDSTNELQMLSMNGDTIFLTDGGFVTVPTSLDNDTTNELQTLSLTNDTLMLSNNGGEVAMPWKVNGANIYRMSNVGFGLNSPLYTIHLLDTLNSTDTAGLKINVIGGSGSGTTYSGLNSEITGGANGDQVAILGRSIGTHTGINQGIYGYARNSSTYNAGVWGFVEGPGFESTGLAGFSNATADYNYGVSGNAYGTDGENYGLIGYAVGGNNTFNAGVFGWNGGVSSAANYAGYFFGDVEISGNLSVVGNISKGGGTFKIDHPLDPENKYLVHSFVESPDMMNIYNGNVVTDSNGYATVTMPDYFDAANKDFRYQLTVIGTFAQAIIKQKMEGNVFVIQTNMPGVEVSWQVTGVRADNYAEKNRVKVEQEKSAKNKGTYLHPDAYGQPAEKGETYKNKPATPPTNNANKEVRR